MAKKSRRARRKETARRPIISQPAPTAQRSQPAAEVTKQEAASAPQSAQARVDFGTEYGYVITDLRSMALIALAMLGVLLALSFVIR